MASQLDFQGFGPTLLGLLEDLYGPISQINATELIRSAGGLGNLFHSLNSIRGQLLAMAPAARERAIAEYRANYSNLPVTPQQPVTAPAIEDFGTPLEPQQPEYATTPQPGQRFEPNLQRQIQALNAALVNKLGYVDLTFLPQSTGIAGGRINVGGSTIDFTLGVNASGQLLFNNNPVTELQNLSPVERVAGFLGQVTSRAQAAPMANRSVQLETSAQAAKAVTNQFFGGGPLLTNLSPGEVEAARARARAAGYEFNQKNLQEHPEWFRQGITTDETGRAIGTGGYLYARDRGHVAGYGIEATYAAAQGAMVTQTPQGPAFLNWKGKPAMLPSGQPDPSVLSKFNKALQDSGVQDVVRLRYSDTGQMLPVVRSPFAQEDILGQRIEPEWAQAAKVAFTTGRMPAGMGLTAGRAFEAVSEQPYMLRGKIGELTPESVFQGEIEGRRQGYPLAPGYIRNTGDWERTQVSIVPGSYQTDVTTGIAQIQVNIKSSIEAEGSIREKAFGRKEFLAGHAPFGAFGIPGEERRDIYAGGVRVGTLQSEGANIITAWENVKNIPGQIQSMMGMWILKHPEAIQQYNLKTNEYGEVRWVEENLPGLRKLGVAIALSPESYLGETFAPEMMTQFNRVWSDRRTRIGPEMMARIRETDPQAYARIAGESQPTQDIYQQVMRGGMYAAGRDVELGATRALSEVAAGAMGAAGAGVGDIGRPNVSAILGGLRVAQGQMGIDERTMLTAEFRRGSRVVRTATSLRVLEYVSGQEFRDDLAGIEDDVVRKSLESKASAFTTSYAKLIMAQASGLKYPEQIIDQFVDAQNRLLRAEQIYKGAISYYPGQAISSPVGGDYGLPKNVYALSDKHLKALAIVGGAEGTPDELASLSDYLGRKSVGAHVWRDPSISGSQMAMMRVRTMRDFAGSMQAAHSDKDFLHPAIMGGPFKGDLDSDRVAAVLAEMGIKYDRTTKTWSGGAEAPSEQEFIGGIIAENKRMGKMLLSDHVKQVLDRVETRLATFTDPKTGRTLTGPAARFAQESELLGTYGAFTLPQIQAQQARGVTHKETMGKIFNMARRLLNLSGLDERTADAMLAPYQSPLDAKEYSAYMAQFVRIVEGYQPATAGLGPGLMGEKPEFFGLFKGDVMGGGMMAMQEALSSFLLAPENSKLASQTVQLITGDPKKQEFILKSLANAQKLNDPRILGFALATATGGELWSATEKFGVFPQTLKAFMMGRWKESKLALPESMKAWAELGGGLTGGTQAMSGRFWLQAQAEGMDPQEALEQTAAGLEEKLGRAAYNEKQRAIIVDLLKRAGLPIGVATEALVARAASGISAGEWEEKAYIDRGFLEGFTPRDESLAFINKGEAWLMKTVGDMPKEKAEWLYRAADQLSKGKIPSFQPANGVGVGGPPGGGGGPPVSMTDMFSGENNPFRAFAQMFEQAAQSAAREFAMNRSAMADQSRRVFGPQADVLGRMQLAFAGRGEMPGAEELSGFQGQDWKAVQSLRQMYYGTSGARSPQALETSTKWLLGKTAPSLGEMDPAIQAQLATTTPEGALNVSRSEQMMSLLSSTRGRQQFHWEGAGIVAGPDLSGMSETGAAGFTKATALYSKSLEKLTAAHEKYGEVVKTATGAEERRLQRYEQAGKMGKEAAGLYMAAEGEGISDVERNAMLAKAGALTTQAEKLAIGRGPQKGFFGRLMYGPEGDEGIAGGFKDLAEGAGPGWKGTLGRAMRGGQLMTGLQLFALSRMERMFVDPALSAAMEGGATEQMLGGALARGGYGYQGLGTAQQATGAYTGMQMAYQRQAAATWSPIVRDVSQMLAGPSGGVASILGPALGAGMAGMMLGGMIGNAPGAVVGGALGFFGTAAAGIVSRQQYLAENPDFAATDAYKTWRQQYEANYYGGGARPGLIERGPDQMTPAEKYGERLVGAAERGMRKEEMLKYTPKERVTIANIRAQQLAQEWNMDPKAVADAMANNALLFGGGVEGEKTLLTALASGVDIAAAAQLSARLGGGGPAQYAQQWAGYAEKPAEFGLAVAGMQTQFAVAMGVVGLPISPPGAEQFARRPPLEQAVGGAGMAGYAEAYQNAIARGYKGPNLGRNIAQGLGQSPTMYAPSARRVTAGLERYSQTYEQVFSVTRDETLSRQLAARAEAGDLPQQLLSMATSAGNQAVSMTGDMGMGTMVMSSILADPGSARMWQEGLGGNQNVMSLAGAAGGDIGRVTRELDTGQARFATTFGLRQSPQLGGGWLRTPQQMMAGIGFNLAGLGRGWGATAGGDFAYTPLNVSGSLNQPLGGMQGLQMQAADLSYQSQMASLGASAANVRRGITFETGIGLGAYGMIDAQGRNTGERFTEGRGSWAVQDEMRDAQRRQQELSEAMGRSNREMNLRQFREQWDMTRTNYQEGWGFNRGALQQQRGWQQEDFATRAGQMQQQRGWTREDWSFNRAQSQMQFGWQMEDIDENIRFATGRERGQLEKAKKRTTITKDTEESRVDTLQKRQETLWNDEDKRFDTEKKRAEETFKLNLARMDMEKKNFLAQSDLQRKHYEERWGVEEDFAAKQKEWMQERWAMEDYLQDLQRTNNIENAKAQLAAIGAQAYYATQLKKNAEDQEKIRQANEEQMNTIKLWEDTSQKWRRTDIELLNRMIYAVSVLKDVDTSGTGSGGGGAPPKEHAGGYHGYLPGKTNIGRVGTAGEMGGEWVDIWPMNRPTLPRFSSNDGGRSGGNTTVIVTLDGQQIAAHVETRSERSLYLGRLR